MIQDEFRQTQYKTAVRNSLWEIHYLNAINQNLVHILVLSDRSFNIIEILTQTNRVTHKWEPPLPFFHLEGRDDAAWKSVLF